MIDMGAAEMREMGADYCYARLLEHWRAQGCPVCSHKQIRRAEPAERRVNSDCAGVCVGCGGRFEWRFDGPVAGDATAMAGGEHDVLAGRMGGRANDARRRSTRRRSGGRTARTQSGSRERLT